MTRKKKPTPKTVALNLPEEVLQQLVPGPLTPEAVQDLFLSFKKAVIERAMGAELGMHLQSETGASQADDEAASKLIWLALRNITADWSRSTREWKGAMNQFAVVDEDRFTSAQQ